MELPSSLGSGWLTQSCLHTPMSIAKEPQFTLENVKIQSASPGWKLDAWTFTPTFGTGSRPVIIMCAYHFYSSTVSASIFNRLSYSMC